jgi:hypothetical protein
MNLEENMGEFTSKNILIIRGWFLLAKICKNPWNGYFLLYLVQKKYIHAEISQHLHWILNADGIVN